MAVLELSIVHRTHRVTEPSPGPARPMLPTMSRLARRQMLVQAPEEKVQ